jgi:hypothetical protein
VLNGSVRLLRAVPVLATSVLVLSGCGVAGTEFHPGIAAEVGDQSITSRDLDRLTHDYCAGYEKLNFGDPEASEPVPMRYVTNQFATILVVRAAAEQLADEYDVEPSSAYKSGLARIEPELEQLSEDEKDAFREILGADSYSKDVLAQIGEISLSDNGTTDANQEASYAEGKKLVVAWIADHDVEVNPRYAVDLGAADFDNASQIDTDLSVAVGTKAKDGLEPAPNSTYTSTLPSHLVCLD